MNKLVFHIFPRMENSLRLLIFMALFGGGLCLQLITGNFWLGAAMIAASSAIMLNKGVDSRLHIERYHHKTEWKPSSRLQIEEIIKMNKSLKRWDRSGFEVSSCLGGFVFLIVVVIGFYFLIQGAETNNNNYIFMAGNFLILFVPQFMTGFKKIDNANRITIYAANCLKTADIVDTLDKSVKVSFLTLLTENAKTKALFPKEVKMKMMLDNAPETFLGCYGQLSINKVGATDFPYFYTVLIFKPEFGLQNKFNNIQLRNTAMLKEFSTDQGVEVLVLRQVTTRTSGYSTNDKAVRGILAQTFEVYKQLVS